MKRIVRRLALLSCLIVITSPSAGDSINSSPFSFEFDASRANVTRTERLFVGDVKSWRILLIFGYKKGESEEELNRLHNAKYELYLTNSVEWGVPVRATWDHFLSLTPRIGRRAREQANRLLLNAMMDATAAAVCGHRGEFTWLPQNRAGLIPLKIKLTRIDSDGERSIVYDGVRETFGHSAEGFLFIFREVMGLELQPNYLYELQLQTLQDSPAFFGVPITVAVDFRTYVIPPELTRSGHAEDIGDYCQSRNKVH